MYIQKAEIKNIRSIENFEIEFKNPAGWHVLIGDNGSGKSTIIRSLALALIGQEQAQGLRANWSDWIHKYTSDGRIDFADGGEIKLKLLTSQDDVIVTENGSSNQGDKISKNLFFGKSNLGIFLEEKKHLSDNSSQERQIRENSWNLSPDEWIRHSGFFSAAYGPYRRFEGGNPEWQKIFENPSFANLAAHLSVFGEDVALTEAISWLKELNYKSLEKNKESRHTLDNLKKLINSEDFLPHNAQLESVSSEGVFFKDGNGTIISVNQMSDGYRSVLSMTFELIRQLVRVYGSEAVFKNIEKGEMFIDLPGVVLVDEIDAHLHPTWQTRIGNWFLKYFPQLQFIVTSHSPLVCRAAEKGSIWRLAAPGSDEQSGEITGLDRERLIYGNILDAYGTEVFGEDVSISQDSVEKQEELVKLNKKKMLDDISPEEEKKLEDLKKVFTTDAQVEL
jgi:predicted ATP-binding protein involved in virulence